MKNNAVKVMIVAAIFVLPVFGGTLMAREHHCKNTAAEIIDAVARLLNPRPVVVTPAPPPPPRPVVVVPALPPPRPVVVAPPPVRHRPLVVHHRPAPPRKHHAPAPPARPVHGGPRR